MKNSFVLYTDFYEVLKDLSDEQLGLLHRVIYRYVISGNDTEAKILLSPEVKMAFNFIKLQIDKNKEKWEETKEKRAEAGKKGMHNRWNEDITKITNITKDNKNNKVIKQITKITKDNNVIDSNDDITKITSKKKIMINTIFLFLCFAKFLNKISVEIAKTIKSAMMLALFNVNIKTIEQRTSGRMKIYFFLKITNPKEKYAA